MPSSDLMGRLSLRASHIADAVLAVLGGAPAAEVATRVGMDAGDLDEALSTYVAAGHAALERGAEQDWHHVRVHFPDWTKAESTTAYHVGPRLDDLRARGAVTGWWFLRKHPCWRIRVCGPANLAASVGPVLDELTKTGLIARWWPTIYEPETAAFGGPAGMHAVHDLFCADSSGVLDYLRRPEPGVGRRELTLLLCGALFRASGLDWFEYGDVFDRVAHLRPIPAEAHTRQIRQLAEAVRPLLAVPAQPDNPLFRAGGLATYATPWLTAFDAAGTTLRRAADTGSLERGLRSVLTHIVIFHWNRLGLSATTQASLAAAARLATLPTD